MGWPIINLMYQGPKRPFRKGVPDENRHTFTDAERGKSAISRSDLRWTGPSDDQMEEFLSLVISGSPVVEAIQKTMPVGIPHFYAWVKTSGSQPILDFAYEISADVLVAEAEMIARNVPDEDNAVKVSRDKFRYDAMMKLAGLRNARRYGQKITIEQELAGKTTDELRIIAAVGTRSAGSGEETGSAENP